MIILTRLVLVQVRRQVGSLTMKSLPFDNTGYRILSISTVLHGNEINQGNQNFQVKKKKKHLG